MMNSLDKNYGPFASHYQEILSMKELRLKMVRCIYLVKIFFSDDLFIVIHIRIDLQMDTDECEVFLYNNLSENPF